MCWIPLSAHKHKPGNIVYRRQREKKQQKTKTLSAHKHKAGNVGYEDKEKNNNKKQKQNTICIGHHYPHTNTKPTT